MDQPGGLLRLVGVDSAYQGPAQVFVRHGLRIEVVRRCDGQRGFVAPTLRWVVDICQAQVVQAAGGVHADDGGVAAVNQVLR